MGTSNSCSTTKPSARRPARRSAFRPTSGTRFVCAEAAKLLTIFSPGGFDNYLEELVALTESQYADTGFMTNLSEKYDIFEH